MTAEYRTAQRLQEALESEYALLSYRLPYVSDAGYLEDGEQESEHGSDAPQESEERYRVKAFYPVGEYEEFEVYRRARLVRLWLRELWQKTFVRDVRYF